MSQPGQAPANDQPPAGAPPAAPDVAELQRQLATAQAALDKANGANASTGRELADLRRKAKSWDDAQTAQQSEAERAAATQAELSRRAEAAERQLAQYAAAASAGLPADMAPRIIGTTPEEMAADAKTLAERLAATSAAGAQQQQQHQRHQQQRPDPTQGAGQSGAPMALNGDPIEDAMRAAVGLPPLSQSA